MLRKLAWVSVLTVSVSLVGCGGGSNDTEATRESAADVSHAPAEGTTSIAKSQNGRIVLRIDGKGAETNSKVKILEISQISKLDSKWGEKLASFFLSNKTPVLFKIEADAEYYATLPNPGLNINLDLKEEVSKENLQIKRVNVDADGDFSFEQIEGWDVSEFMKCGKGRDTYVSVVAAAPALKPGYYIVEVSSDIFAPRGRWFDPTPASTVADDISATTGFDSTQKTEINLSENGVASSPEVKAEEEEEDQPLKCNRKKHYSSSEKE
ncbi:Polysaccharide lyase family 8, super-sandwich domain protein [Mycoavidus cysteinexigens]|uniref:Polysaccharide lyase family 8, super-sandwich domain protein n=1 Tax=Mycoavidus cysteinexigens TaxID=1553431 RepID=A0A2Z6ETA7_9BURK|nr:hypothetical protein [Mycoavidus cysteinexigens]BBE08646.1 Polysaccharide lyase family 8, super-sandwich domain protein [Mycoavidus cysteinexigens]GAM52649.1 hypothetical protein EBME_1112 [bacterium endosymbiont of Mortierella elongata FMR23-6]GLR01490.1 hypothetical protein GCM10007934_13020 [Mycoavidus cysteinexigens]